MGNKMCTCASEEIATPDKQNLDLQIPPAEQPLKSPQEKSVELPVIMQAGAGHPEAKITEKSPEQKVAVDYNKSQGKQAEPLASSIQESGPNKVGISPIISPQPNPISPTPAEKEDKQKTIIVSPAPPLSNSVLLKDSSLSHKPSTACEPPLINVPRPTASVAISPTVLPNRQPAQQKNRRAGTSHSPSTIRRNRYTNYVTQALKISKLIPSSFASDSSVPEGKMVLEGTLLKYKPGVNESYLERWIRLSKTTFSYFANKPSTGPKTPGSMKPIIKIPLSCIDSAQRVFVETDTNYQRGGTGNTKPTLYQFEIFLKPAVNISQIFKSSVSSLDQIKRRANSLTKPTFRSPDLKGGKLDESKTTQSKTPYEFKSTYLGGGQDASLCEVSTKKVRGEIMDQILEDMPLAQPVKRSRAKNWIPEHRSEELLLVLDGAHFESSAEKEEYRNYKKAHLEELKQVWVKEDQPQIQNLAKWSQREMEWSKAERRLLFAAESEEICNNWVSVINWILSKYYPRY